MEEEGDINAYIKPGIGRGFVLVHNGHRYQRNKTNVRSMSWRCWRKDCQGRASTDVFPIVDGASPTAMEVTIEHDHEGEGDTISREDVVQEIRGMVEDDPSRPIKRIYNEVAGRREDREENAPAYESLRSRMKRARQEHMPPIPRTIDDVHIEGEWRRTWRGRQFLSLVDNVAGVLIFITVTCLEILGEINTVYVDGTFKSAPTPYTQLVTIHGRYLDNVFLLAYALVTGKRLEQYKRILQHLKDEVAALGGVFSPTQVISDYEVAIRTAFSEEFPGIRIKGCYFHLTQSMWRKVQDLGLVAAYNNDARAKRILRKTFALGYLPVAMVRQDFVLLRNSQQAARVIAVYPAVGDFFAYINDTYINGQFPIPTWNVFDRRMEFRTTNVVEGFHQKWNREVGINHPSIWLFIRRLKDEERNERVRLRQARMGDLLFVRRRKWRRLERRIARLRNSYNVGALTLMQYWRAITYAIKSYH